MKILARIIEDGRLLAIKCDGPAEVGIAAIVACKAIDAMAGAFDPNIRAAARALLAAMLPEESMPPTLVVDRKGKGPRS